jgi:uncharacterized protein YecT (DUF1311 family)
MVNFPANPGGLFLVSRVRSLASLFIGMALLPAGAYAQQSTPPPAQPPASAQAAPAPPVAFENAIPPEKLAFLNDYAGKPASALRKDKRFRQLMKLAVPRTVYHYGHDLPLDEAIDTVLDGPPMPTDIRDGRYVMVSSHGGPYLRGKGFVWFDMQTGIALGCFFFRPTNGEPTPTLTIFSRQLKAESMAMSQLPLPFAEDLAQWALVTGVPAVTPRYFIPDNGKKYVLIHDEDYCSSAAGAPAPDQNACEQMNFAAADADFNAADFMAQTGNRANATAWMLEPQQMAWITVRDQTCGAGLGCRIRMTRERTRIILRQHS